MFATDVKMLVVDDEPVMRAMLRDELAAEGFTNIVEAVDGRDALARLTEAVETTEPFEVIISDWNMPNMTGLELLEKVQENPEIKNNTSFIFVTSQAEISYVYQAILLGVSSYITKPIVKGVLREKLEIAWNVKQKSSAS